MALIASICSFRAATSEAAVGLFALRARVVHEAKSLLESTEVSYVYGGTGLGSESDCTACNQCLGLKAPSPTQRLKACPQCGSCSLDCSHFTQLVFQRAGLAAPYLSTQVMREMSPEALRRSYQLVPQLEAAPGDLLVYPGHVVILERIVGPGLGDIIHVTSGLELKGPGTAIQRVRQAPLASFRGPLQRILRHAALASIADTASKTRRLQPRLRPIVPPAE